jgi:hypothetical protein
MRINIVTAETHEAKEACISHELVPLSPCNVSSFARKHTRSSANEDDAYTSTHWLSTDALNNSFDSSVFAAAGLPTANTAKAETSPPPLVKLNLHRSCCGLGLVERLRNPRVVHLHRNTRVSSDCMLHRTRRWMLKVAA